MKPIANIWLHPKTSTSGLLIAVVTIGRVFSQQGISFGTVGNGSALTLILGVATALLGLMARDPSGAATTASDENSTQGATSTAQLGCWALIALLVTAPFTTGCSGTSVAQNIVNWTPTLQSVVATVDATASILDPASAPIFTAATSGFDAASNVLVTQAKAYLANPTATVLQQLQTQVVTFQQQVNAALLLASKITNPASQQKALADINAVATVVNALLALIASISNKAAVAQMSAAVTVKLAQVEPYMDEGSAVRIVARQYGEPVTVAAMQVAQAQASAAQAGF